MVSNQNQFYIFHILVLTLVLDYRQVIPDHVAIREPMYPSWYPKTHAPLVPQAQAGPTHHPPVMGSRSPSKLGLQAPAPEYHT